MTEQVQSKITSIKKTKEFLMELTEPKKTPRIPKYIRQKAKECLIDYPSGFDEVLISKGLEAGENER
jgi:hypothetical protein